MSDVQISGRNAIMSSERYRALGTAGNRTLEVINAAQAEGLPVHGAREFGPNDFAALDQDREGGVYFALVFSREPEPEDDATADDLEDQDDAEVEADLMEALGFGSVAPVTNVTNIAVAPSLDTDTVPESEVTTVKVTPVDEADVTDFEEGFGNGNGSEVRTDETVQADEADVEDFTDGDIADVLDALAPAAASLNEED